MSEKLKPCPFCLSPAEVRVREDNGDYSWPEFPYTAEDLHKEAK